MSFCKKVQASNPSVCLYTWKTTRELRQTLPAVYPMFILFLDQQDSDFVGMRRVYLKIPSQTPLQLGATWPSSDHHNHVAITHGASGEALRRAAPGQPARLVFPPTLSRIRAGAAPTVS